MKIRLLLSFLLTISVAAIASDDTGIFVDKPDLTWKKFEKEFRAQYPDLAIPIIKEVNDMPKVIWDEKSGRYVDIHNASFSDTVAGHFTQEGIVFYSAYLVKRGKLSSEAMKTVLLHETGHHFYPKDKKKENMKNADQVFLDIKSVAAQLDYANPIATKIAMGINGCHILMRGPNIKLLCALFMIQNAECFLAPLLDAYGRNRMTHALKRPEEIAADQYAFQRASTQSLKAFDNDVLSLRASLTMQKDALDKRLENVELNGFVKNAVGIEMKLNELLQKARYKYSIIHDLIDPAHPCDRDRSAAIAAELKRRGK